MKPVSAIAALHRLRDIAQLESPLPLRGPTVRALEQATQRVAPGQFEQAVREAIVELREAVARLSEQPDPLVRYLGFRTLAQEVTAAELDGKALSARDEQAYVRTLVQQIQGQAAQGLEQLDASARNDLEVLLRFEERTQLRQERRHLAEAASGQRALAREQLERLQGEFKRYAALDSRAAVAPRPAWLRLLGVILAVSGLGLAGVKLDWQHLRQSPSAWLWVWVCGAALLLSTGIWLSIDPKKRRDFIQARLQQLFVRRKSAEETERDAAHALERARALFDEVDALCRQDEAAALAVLQRRPGVRRYLGAQSPLVLPPVTSV